MAAFSTHPLTPDRWPDLVRLFGQRGACGGCWCMYDRRARSVWERNKGSGNRDAFRRIVKRGDEPGLIGYLGDEPVAWCAVAARSVYVTLARSRILKPVDDAPVWSITCFFVARPHRRRGLSVRMLKAVTRHARSRGAGIVEGYPVIPRDDLPDAFAWTGVHAAYVKAGFVEVARRSKTRPIMRWGAPKRK